MFALGNKTYENYNTMGRFVDKKLKEMNATCVYERGEGDDDGKYVCTITPDKSVYFNIVVIFHCVHVVSVTWAVVSVTWAGVSVTWAGVSVTWAVVSVTWAGVSVTWAGVSVTWAGVS